MDRRVFLGGGVLAGAGAAGASAGERHESLLASGDAPRLPGLGQGARLLFQGDSITDMNRGRDERDRNHYLGHSYVYLIAARVGVAMAADRLAFYNRGVSGNTVADLRRRWRQDTLDLRPDLLSILVGTNDVAQGVEPGAFEDDYRRLLDASREQSPGLRLVLIEPFVLPTGPLKDPAAWRGRRAATDRLRGVVARLAEDYRATLVPTQALFDAAARATPPDHWIWDGVHPLPQGHELIARSWLQAVGAAPA